jgi:hypothetical protein
MKKYQVLVNAEMNGYMLCEKATKEEAIEKAQEHSKEIAYTMIKGNHSERKEAAAVEDVEVIEVEKDEDGETVSENCIDAFRPSELVDKMREELEKEEEEEERRKMGE